MSEENRSITIQLKLIEKKAACLFQILRHSTHLFLDGLVTRDLDVEIVDRACQLLILNMEEKGKNLSNWRKTRGILKEFL